ncbi:hypothetical protein BWI96_16940 [Siphonobacter sp. SORGH_AS_0500]|uniref:glycerophosphodiester phosphodiesterase family protein n=1 Tax=Siphonobacter sp. SORGH_AS_0500 TaxID=1864824 RepID=UPI000CB1C49D|nr:glycerophosphodiester phosphodiesterase family protein [Siphonobacter sp. SORGH_AS_0500]PKK35399.1 hypothetical protein BWI96_16940 [Siphonobacter sp. SORGH_AS_0500]
MIRFLFLTCILLTGHPDFQPICRKKNEPLQQYFKWEKNKKLIMAHRTTPVSGYSENTLAALQHAYQLSPCATQEIDVRMSKDSVLMLLHDASLERTTTGKGNLNEFTYQELRKLELKDERGRVLKGQRIPKLDELLTFAKHKIVLFLDMKPGTDPKRLMQTLVKHRMVTDVVVICYNVAEAQKLHRQYPSLMIALGFNDAKAIDAITTSGIPYENLVALTPSQVQPAAFYDRIHQMGIMTSWGANNTVDHLPFAEAKAQYQDALLTGADIICTDSLQRVQSLFVTNPQSTSRKN